MIIRSEAKRGRVTEIIFLKTCVGVGNCEECNGNQNTFVFEAFWTSAEPLPMEAAVLFFFFLKKKKTHVIAMLQLQGPG